MVADPGLVSYILRYHEQGYDVNTLRNTLAQQGYTPQAIEEAITEATRQGKVVQQKLPVGKTHGNMLLLIGVVSVGLIGIAIFGLFFLGGEEEEEAYVPTPTERPTFDEPVETAPAEPVAPVEPVQPVAPVEPIAPVTPVEPAQQPISAMNADELKLEILRNTKRIKNYGFIENIVTTLNGQKTTIKNDGRVDRENKKLSGTFDKVDVFVQDDIVYSKMGDSWVMEDLIEEDFFLLEREISLLEESDIGILNEDPLEILISFNKEIIGERMARELFAEQTAFFDDYYIDYEEALTIETDFNVDENLVIQKIGYDITLTANNLTVVPKNGVMFNESYVMERNTTTTFLSFNTLADIIVPDTVVNESISLDDYLAGLVITPPINVTGTNVTGTNTTGNETGNQTT